MHNGLLENSEKMNTTAIAAIVLIVIIASGINAFSGYTYAENNGQPQPTLTPTPPPSTSPTITPTPTPMSQSHNTKSCNNHKPL